jgi:glycosyltransferase involved in cell wall biosynthesis
MQSLLIISDTALVRGKDGKILGFGPVVNELNIIKKSFSKVVWIGFERKDKENDRSMIEIPDEVECVLLKRVGGSSFWHKIEILLMVLPYSKLIYYHISKHDVIHTRGPSLPAAIAVLFSIFKHNKIWWHKYAGNWNELNPPLFYGIQKKLLLLSSKSKVTINGSWPNTPNHCLPFENPCIYDQEIDMLARKDFSDNKYSICFVGALNPLKGVNILIEALMEFGVNRFEIIRFIGGGPQIEEYRSFFDEFNNVEFTGFLSRTEIENYLKMSHFLILPSFSEGFPKVIAEACCFGTIPISTDISCISQYINDSNGIIIEKPTSNAIIEALEKIYTIPKTKLGEMSINAKKMAKEFTYERFYDKVKNEILNKEIIE